MHLKRAATLLILIVSILGCASTADQRPGEQPAQITDKEFVAEVVIPVIRVMTAITAYHAEKHSIPDSPKVLIAYADKMEEPIDWHRFSRLELSKDTEGSHLLLTVNSLSSLSKTGEVSTAWRLSITETGLKDSGLRFAIAPMSSFCVSPTPGPPPSPHAPSKVELFLDLLLGYRTVPSSAREAPHCFRATEGKPSASQDRLKGKLREMLRNKQEYQ